MESVVYNELVARGCIVTVGVVPFLLDPGILSGS